MSATVRLPKLYDVSAFVGIEALFHGCLLGCEYREKHMARDGVALAHDTIGADLDLEHLSCAAPSVSRHGRKQLWELHKFSRSKMRGTGTQSGNCNCVNRLHGGVRA